jgi:hypothetical protein
MSSADLSNLMRALDPALLQDPEVKPSQAREDHSYKKDIEASRG